MRENLRIPSPSKRQKRQGELPGMRPCRSGTPYFNLFVLGFDLLGQGAKPAPVIVLFDFRQIFLRLIFDRGSRSSIPVELFPVWAKNPRPPTHPSKPRKVRPETSCPPKPPRAPGDNNPSTIGLKGLVADRAHLCRGHLSARMCRIESAGKRPAGRFAEVGTRKIGGTRVYEGAACQHHGQCEGENQFLAHL